MPQTVKIIFIAIAIIMLVVIIIALGINFFVMGSTKEKIISEEQAKDLQDVDCILVLGAGVWGEKPSPMLEDRILQAIALYKNGTAPKIIMSGDHRTKEYDEVNVMKDYAIEKEVPSEDIFMDHAGFSTYESMYRASEIFGVKKMVIVTQGYHLYRSLYIAEKMGIEAYGVASDPQKYSGQAFREIREIAARNKDYFQCIFKPLPTYLGKAIPVSGNGDVTNDAK